ncbi:MAG: hypothetical protein AB1505_17155 [Candidatus Latescibacterota bacterium]
MAATGEVAAARGAVKVLPFRPVARGGLGFGTAPVFLAAISTILGAVLFLRFGYAVGHAGLLGALVIVVLGHAVTVPTALAIAEIATNRRVEGGGEYFIISRSFGTTIGASIGIALYFSQAISVAFYMIAFAEAFQPLAPLVQEVAAVSFDPRMVSLPGVVLLVVLMVVRGASVGVKALWVVVSVLPGRAGRVLASGTGAASEPRAATLLTGAVAVLFVGAGSVNFVARIISMFFMVTYGSLCAISFLEHFAARPSYRPTFRSSWYLSLLGAVACLLLMFQMDPVYAALALCAMAVIYRAVRATQQGRGDNLAAIFKAAMIQATRHMQVKLQSSPSARSEEQWRPAIIMVNSRTFERTAPLQFLGWLCHRHAVGTYLHHLPGPLDRAHFEESRSALEALIRTARGREPSVYVDTIVSPSMRSALAQSLQVPGIAGMENNTVLFEFSVHDPESVVTEVADGCHLAAATDMDMLVLRHGDRFFGGRSSIDIWLTWHDYRNAPLMLLLAYMLLGHPAWRRAEIRILAAVPEAEAAEEAARLGEMVASGRIPVSPRNLTVFPTAAEGSFDALVCEHSSHADLALFGFTPERLGARGVALFARHPERSDALFVCSRQEVRIA